MKTRIRMRNSVVSVIAISMIMSISCGRNSYQLAAPQVDSGRDSEARGPRIENIHASLVCKQERPIDALLQLSPFLKEKGLLILVECTEDSFEPFLDYDLPDTNLPAMLDQIVSRTGRYTWSQDSCVINIVPKRFRDDPNYIMNRRLPAFHAVGLTRSEIVSTMMANLETLAPGTIMHRAPDGTMLTALMDFPIPYKEFGMTPPILPKHTIDATDVSVRDIMNSIAISEKVEWNTYAHSKLPVMILSYPIPFSTLGSGKNRESTPPPTPVDTTEYKF